MEKLCDRCKKNESGGAGEIVFAYLGMLVKAFKVGSRCEDCAKAEWIKDFEDTNAKEFFDVVDGKPIVNWQKYKERRFVRAGGIADKARLHDTLRDIGVFSYEAKGNWEIVAHGPIGLNPRIYLSYLYFINKEDAIEFARLEYCRAEYHWWIHHIGEVIYKEEIIEKK